MARIVTDNLPKPKVDKKVETVIAYDGTGQSEAVNQGSPATSWFGKVGVLAAPDPDRQMVIATECLWHRSSRRLVYRAGQVVPEDEMPSLIGDAEIAIETARRRASQ